MVVNSRNKLKVGDGIDIDSRVNNYSYMLVSQGDRCDVAIAYDAARLLLFGHVKQIQDILITGADTN